MQLKIKNYLLNYYNKFYYILFNDNKIIIAFNIK